MANPQKERGYVGVANDIWDEVIRRDFTKRQKDILLFIWRLSYGCGQKAAIVPKQRDFAICGIGEGHIKAELDYLIRCKVIFRDKEKKEFQFNKDYDFWKINPGRDWDDDRFRELVHINLKEAKKTRSKLTETVSSPPDEPEEELTETVSSDNENLPKREVGLTETVSSTTDFPIQDVASESPKKGLKKKDIKKEDMYIKHVSIFESYTSNQELLETLESFVDFRKQIKSTMTDRAIKLLLGELDKLSNSEKEKVEILNQSIFKNWKGVFALKSNGSDKVPPDVNIKLPMNARKPIPLII